LLPAEAVIGIVDHSYYSNNCVGPRAMGKNVRWQHRMLPLASQFEYRQTDRWTDGRTDGQISDRCIAAVNMASIIMVWIQRDTEISLDNSFVDRTHLTNLNIPGR